MKFKLVYILFLIVILNINIIKSQYIYTYYTSGLGSDENGCTSSQPCNSIQRVIEYFKLVMNYQYSTITNQFPPLVIYIQQGTSFYSSLNSGPTTSSSIDLYQFNVTFIGVNDQDNNQVSFVNSNPFSLFTINPDFWTVPTQISFVNLNYGRNTDCLASSGYGSSSNSNSGSGDNGYNGDFIELSATYNIQLSVSFVDFTYSCISNDRAFIFISGEINSIQAASQDWEENYYGDYPSSSYSFSFINSVFSSANASSQLSAPIFNSTYSPATLSIIQSTFSDGLQTTVSPFILSRGQLIVEKSTFISPASPSLQCLASIFEMYNVEVYFNENQVQSWPIHKNILIECNGCFFTGVGNTISSSFYSGENQCSNDSYTLFSFTRSAVTIMNTNITMDSLDGNYSSSFNQDSSLIYARDSQISLRSNLIYSSFGPALNFGNVKSFMFSNVFSYSQKPIVYCDSNSMNIFNGDDFSKDIRLKGYNCDRYSETNKIKTGLMFSGIGIGITFASLIFLYVSRYAIKRCSGPL